MGNGEAPSTTHDRRSPYEARSRQSRRLVVKDHYLLGQPRQSGIGVGVGRTVPLGLASAARIREANARLALNLQRPLARLRPCKRLFWFTSIDTVSR